MRRYTPPNVKARSIHFLWEVSTEHSACAPELSFVLGGNVQRGVMYGAEKHLPSIQRQPMRLMWRSLCRSQYTMTALRTNLLVCLILMHIPCSVCHSYVSKTYVILFCIHGSYFMIHECYTGCYSTLLYTWPTKDKIRI